MQIVRLFDEVATMVDLKDTTLDLIHATTYIKAIKKLVEAHDIIDLNLTIEKRFSEYDDPPWDICALSDLARIRRELILFHRPEFSPVHLLDQYSQDMVGLFRRVQIRHRLTDSTLALNEN